MIDPDALGDPEQPVSARALSPERRPVFVASEAVGDILLGAGALEPSRGALSRAHLAVIPSRGRGFIGARLYSAGMRTHIVAAGVVIEKGRVLLSRRKSGTHLAGSWEFPGGKAEPGEDPRAALRRELEEELGIVVRVGEIVDVTFHPYPDADKAVLLLFFRAEREADSPEPRAIDVAEFEWAGAGALDPARFPPADVAILAKVRTLLSS
jgi:8-oxo-dGTP diphosphatase